MVKYQFPAVEGKVTEIELYDPKKKEYKKGVFKIPKDVKVTNWHSYGDVVVLETDKEVEEWKKYKVE